VPFDDGWVPFDDGWVPFDDGAADVVFGVDDPKIFMLVAVG
jgi:hypothetical protein